MTFKVRKIITGGQTGVDRAALDAALEEGISIGGYVPLGRQAEDGRISDKYPELIETESDDPAHRTELNVMHSDATLIISRGALSGGSALTKECVEKHRKDLLHIELTEMETDLAAMKVKDWLDSRDINVLNIAGPRASEDPEIYTLTLKLLQKAL